MMSPSKLLFFRIGLIALALFLSSLCYLYGAWHRVPGAIYSGMRSINASDYNVNLSWIEQYRQGNFLLKNLYTSEEHRGFLARPIYFLLVLPFGKSSVSNTAVFHILRVVCGFVLLLALFSLLRAYERDNSTTNLAFLLITFTSGAGVLLKKWMLPPDFGIPEYFLFQTLGEAPHFLYSLLLFWTGITAIYFATQNKRGAILCFFVALVLLWWDHPYDVIPLAAVAFVNLWQIPTRRNQLLVVAGSAVFSVAPYLYYRSLQRLPVFAAWAAQNVTRTPSLLWLLCAFLPLIVLSVFGSMVLWRNPEKRKLLFFLVTWILIQILLAFLPVPFQRRLSAGVQFPLAILAAYGLKRIQRPALVVAILVLFTSSNVYVTWQQIVDLKTGQMPFYLPISYQKAFQWLASQPEKGVVLSGFVTGNFIPAYSGLPVYLGHSHQSPDAPMRKQRVVDFYRHPDPGFLKNNRIRYIFWGREERQYSDPALERMFPKAYDQNGIMIFRTDLERPVLASSKMK